MPNDNTFKQLALIGPTASGKTALSIKAAQKFDAYILSLDSLSIYKEIDIVSAKPSKEERGNILHFGLDHIRPDQHFDVKLFIDLYHQVYQKCLEDQKNLIIVGGTSFYLKMLIDGISALPKISDVSKEKTKTFLKDIKESHAFLYTLDPDYISSIESTDAYRMEKALNIYFQTQLTPTQYFRENPPTPSITLALPIYQIVWDRALLRKRIALRTQLMIKEGLIDEVCMLEKKYTRTPHCMKSIGIKETLAYLDGIYDKKMLIEKITTNTARLAKRQTTFNNSQFENVIKGSVGALEKLLVE
ncbi:MAG: tRNA (adenosine(37)-N6)-dimethylallyltransferase MiaA [Campylobacterota bacterium]|nr:tRNA (adenosine(37)-N6)-dimethylallyltransferase MiaA [Campylobacterota bacterium]